MRESEKNHITPESAIERFKEYENEQRICRCSCGCKQIVGTDSPALSLCRSCLIASGSRFDNSEDPPCEECNANLQDPAIKGIKWGDGTVDGAVRLHLRLNQFICDWCLLAKSENENRFIKTRIGDALDHEGLDLSRAKNLKWRTARLLGKAFGDEWNDYLVQYIGLVRHKFRKPTTSEEAKKKLGNKLSHLFFSIIHNHVWVIEVRRMRIFYKFSRGYIDISYTSQRINPPHVKLINVEYIQTLEAFNNQAKKLWKGLALRALVEARSFKEAEAFGEKLDREICKLLQGNNNPTQRLLAQMLKLGVGDSGKKQFQRRCKRFGIDYKERVRYWRSQI